LIVRLALAVIAVVGVQAGAATPTLSARFDILPIDAGTAARLLVRTTVEVNSLGCDLSLRQGTAVVVAPERVMTNEHVVSASRSVDVSADGVPVIAASLVLASPSADLAVVDAGGLATVPLALSPDDPLPGEPVRVAGFPHDAGTVKGATIEPDGLVVAATTVLDYVDGAPMGHLGPVMRLSIGVGPGMSGGPVLDRAGRLAGLLFAEQSPTGDALAIPVSELRQVLAAGLERSPRC
jgi:S1-C subfamily serine protease